MKVSIGEDENDPVFVITDLLVHLAQEQLEKKASQVIEGEKLDLLIGNRPIEKADDLKKEEKDAVKQNVLNILKEMYGIDEEDFIRRSWRSFRQEKPVTADLTEV